MAFGWDDAFLLSMSAAGALISTRQAGQNIGMVRQGRQLEQAAIDTNLESLRNENAQSSLESIQQLRLNVENQVVTNAARGVSSGAGSGLAGINQSESNFGKDENTRRLNLLMKENELRSAGVLSGLHTLQSETKIGQSLTKQIFDTLPISGLAKRFGLGGKKESTKKSGFGLDQA